MKKIIIVLMSIVLLMTGFIIIYNIQGEDDVCIKTEIEKQKIKEYWIEIENSTVCEDPPLNKSCIQVTKNIRHESAREILNYKNKTIQC